MNKLFIVIFAFISITFTFACSNNETASNSVNSNTEKTVEKQTYKSIGVIKAMDVSNDKITIDHEDIPGYMPPMEMTESVSDKSLLSGLKRGDKVDFEIERTGSKLLVTKLTKIGEVALINTAGIYKTNCAECHGEKGEGAKKGISFLKGHALDHTEEDFIKTVTNGKKSKKGDEMPAFKDKLSEQEIAEVVKFVREVIQKDAVKENSHSHKH